MRGFGLRITKLVFFGKSLRKLGELGTVYALVQAMISKE